MPNYIEITDFRGSGAGCLARLSEGQLLNRHEPEKGIFIGESPKVVERALNVDVSLCPCLRRGSTLKGKQGK